MYVAVTVPAEERQVACSECGRDRAIGWSEESSPCSPTSVPLIPQPACTDAGHVRRPASSAARQVAGDQVRVRWECRSPVE
jgi:hypothetical protein